MTPRQHHPHHPTTNGSSSNGYEIMLNGSKSYEIVQETNGGASSSKDMTTTMTTTTTTMVKRLTYRINGHLAFWVTLLLLNVGWPTWKNVVTTSTTTTTTPSSSASAVVLTFGKAPLTWLYDHYTLLAFVTIIYALCLSTYLYIKSYNYEINSTTTGGKKVPVLLAAGGNSGNVIYDYFMGRELNPRSIDGTFDWKEFCELRPGLIGWCILNMAMLSKQYNKLGYVTGSMI
jgi:hypothetical protein